MLFLGSNPILTIFLFNLMFRFNSKYLFLLTTLVKDRPQQKMTQFGTVSLEIHKIDALLKQLFDVVDRLFGVIMKARLFAHLEEDASRWHLFHQSYFQIASPDICCRVRVVDHHRSAFAKDSTQTCMHFTGVFRLLLFTRVQSLNQLLQIDDLPEPGTLTNITRSCPSFANTLLVPG